MSIIARIFAATVLALPALSAAAVDVREVESPGGMTFWLVEEASIPIVSVEISFEGGARLDPEGKAGLARFMTGLLDEGAGDLDTVAFTKERDRLAARFGFDAGRDEITVSLQMLKETAEGSTALLASALADPRFDEEPVARLRAQILSSIASSQTDPQDVASRAWYARAFPGHPYGTPVEGTADTVAAITREDLVAAHERLLTRTAATIAVVGDVDAAAAGEIVDTLMSDLPEGEPVPPAPEAGPPPPGTEIVSLDVPQSVAIFGQEGLPLDHPDYFAAHVMNYVLGGGGFVSRLTEEVRVKRGLAYGVYSYLAPRDGADLYLGSTQTANARMAESLEVIRAEWRRMKEEGATAEEVEAAKQYLTGAFPLRFDSNGRIAGFLVFAQQEELGIDYIDVRNGFVEAVTVEDVNRVAAELLDPDALSIVVVGQPAGL